MTFSEIYAIPREDKDAIMDSGACNEALCGYLIEAMRSAGFERDEIAKAVSSLRAALDEVSAAEARDIYRRW